MTNPEKSKVILTPENALSVERKIVITEDGSTTISIPELNENYHSIHGATRESMHVYIDAGLKQIEKDVIKIFEVGLGTGLNCLLTYLNSSGRKIEYHAIEKYPIEKVLLDQLNYSQLLANKNEAHYILNLIHSADWNTRIEITPGFYLQKFKKDIAAFEPEGKYHLIYFDAFAPEVQPELWVKEVFQKTYDMLETGGILVTYCAKGEVRRTMQSCGFLVERLPGPPGKREMLRAQRS